MMGIDLTWYFVFILGVGVLSYYLGRRKTQTPLIAGLLGMVVSIFPPFGLLFLIVLMLKNDVDSKQSTYE
jgi:hypothetical protein